MTEWIEFLTKMAVLATPLLILCNTFVSMRNGRKLALTKADVAEVHDLVNGKTERLEKLLIAKAKREGALAERSKKRKTGGGAKE